MIKVLKTELETNDRSIFVGTCFKFDKSSRDKGEPDTFEKCLFCNLKNHKSRRCLRITEPAARKKQTLKRNRNFFICFDTGHPAENCTLIIVRI